MFQTSAKLLSDIAFALAELKRLGGDPAALPAPLRITVVIHAAQGVIDNGGLQYFFEADFPESPPYSVFVDAYREVGAVVAAQALADAVALFPFEEPNKDAKKRNDFMDSFKDEDGEPANSPFDPLTDHLCGNSEVWTRLEAYVTANEQAFRR